MNLDAATRKQIAALRNAATLKQTAALRFLLLEDFPQLGLKISKAQVYRLIKTAGFPQARRLSDARSVWLEHEVLAWMASRPVALPRPVAQPKAQSRPVGKHTAA